jgi:hypothetical protein
VIAISQGLFLGFHAASEICNAARDGAVSTVVLIDSSLLSALVSPALMVFYL